MKLTHWRQQRRIGAREGLEMRRVQGIQTVIH